MQSLAFSGLPISSYASRCCQRDGKFPNVGVACSSCSPPNVRGLDNLRRAAARTPMRPSLSWCSAAVRAGVLQCFVRSLSLDVFFSFFLRGTRRLAGRGCAGAILSVVGALPSAVTSPVFRSCSRAASLVRRTCRSLYFSLTVPSTHLAVLRRTERECRSDKTAVGNFAESER